MLDYLKPDDLALLAPLIADCQFRGGHVLHRPGETMEYCYFPRGRAVAAFAVMLEDGKAVDVMMVGCEGALGGIVSEGGLPAFAGSRVMHRGAFQRIALADLERAKQASPAIRDLFARYADCLMAQVFQSIACNATHTIEQRAARWLDAAVARTGECDIAMTQEQLAAMMGIGRSYASRVIQRFKRDGLLRTRRGGVDVLDADGLAARACGCNARVSRHREAVLGGLYSAAT
ncbi:Crp/Fnr family transcriptional regulator [Novosphingobium album (ex Liu et al. 2023)]|uniref:Crp/Fnr family transcriptional regulator n=1 Tax=Novosphingobium album (ex Liu et al. 2023) TaxID=3031130 RepID=A0ABT5WNN3_9SPHN|nr:Crp/Fnr family transcriptional regulator [Novosphingobium album (ex Liu et al. 2023)]MDE8651341.1 Crp/Fnr family transcriptional regulator [Novosphingobium album (ex Liu et al. 2023)]